jgi:hypothetical protein
VARWVSWLGKLPRLLLKIVVAVAAYAVVYLLADNGMRGANQPWSYVIALLVSSVVFLAQFLFDVDRRLHDVHTGQVSSVQTSQALVDRRFAEINAATSLYALLTASPIEITFFEDLAKHVRGMHGRHDLIRQLAVTELHRVGRLLKELHDTDRASYEGEDRDWLMALVTNTVSSIDALCMISRDRTGQVVLDGGPLRSDRSRRYLDAQLTALQRQGSTVLIRKIFVLDPELLDEPEVGDLIRGQRAAGITVQLLDPANPPVGMPVVLPEFTVFDRAAVYEPLPGGLPDAGGRPVLTNTRLETEQQKVTDRLTLFETIWKLIEQQTIPANATLPPQPATHVQESLPVPSADKP